MKARAILVAVGLVLAAPLGADNRLAIKVSPAVAFAPANLIVRTIIEANGENRAVEIVAESESFYRSSEIQLEGDRAPRTTTFEFKSVPGGVYEVTATLLGVHGQRLRTVRQEVNVISNGGK
jgi:hypothetical protein